LPERQPDVEKEVRGPAVGVAYAPDGAPTGAAIGFAKKQGVAVESLEKIETSQGSYILARFTEAGKPAVEVLGRCCRRPYWAFTSLSSCDGAVEECGSCVRFGGSSRYLGGESIDMEIGGVRSGRSSRGHRFLAPDDFEVASPYGFLDQLESRFVMTDPERRRSVIRKQADGLAQSAGGSIPWDDELLDENVWLTEWPTAVLGLL
jgi:glycyl-tRNA synthetase beta chain